MYSNKENVNILTALLVKHGVKHVVVCPGSRNAPLVHNFAMCPDLICHQVTDERSAGFVALGIASSGNGELVAVCVTSGSALLNVLPAAAEASYQRRGIIVVSADRPAAWINQLDGQTLSQHGALGNFVAKSVSLPEPKDVTERWYCNRLVNEALLECKRTGIAVHINVPITEPLFDFSVESLPDERMISLSRDCEQSLGVALCKAKRPMVVVGQMHNCADIEAAVNTIGSRITVMAEPLSCGKQWFVDQMLYAVEHDYERYLPDLIIYIGGHTVSKRLRQFIRRVDDTCEVWMVNPLGLVEDVSMHATGLLEMHEHEALMWLQNYVETMDAAPSEYYVLMDNLRKSVAKRHESFVPQYSQMLAVKQFEECVGNEGVVHYANSTAVRLASIYAKDYRFCNRGLNGIEGSLSVAAGAALAAFTNGVWDDARKSGNVFCVIGDLSFFYDENALWQHQLSGNFRVLLLNNGQGGIFRNLKGLEMSPVRDELVSAAHDVSAEGVCRQFGVTYLRADDAESLCDGINKLVNVPSERPVLLEVMTDVNVDEKEYKRYYHSFSNAASPTIKN